MSDRLFSLNVFVGVFLVISIYGLFLFVMDRLFWFNCFGVFDDFYLWIVFICPNRLFSLNGFRVFGDFYLWIFFIFRDMFVSVELFSRFW